MKLRFTILLKDLIVWSAIVGLGVALWLEHTSARTFEQNTRRAVENAFQQLLSRQ